MSDAASSVCPEVAAQALERGKGRKLQVPAGGLATPRERQAAGSGVEPRPEAAGGPVTRN